MKYLHAVWTAYNFSSASYPLYVDVHIHIATHYTYPQPIVTCKYLRSYRLWYYVYVLFIYKSLFKWKIQPHATLECLRVTWIMWHCGYSSFSNKLQVSCMRARARARVYVCMYVCVCVCVCVRACVRACMRVCVCFNVATLENVLTLLTPWVPKIVIAFSPVLPFFSGHGG